MLGRVEMLRLHWQCELKSMDLSAQHETVDRACETSYISTCGGESLGNPWRNGNTQLSWHKRPESTVSAIDLDGRMARTIRKPESTG